jgi:hypothetical protein
MKAIPLTRTLNNVWMKGPCDNILKLINKTFTNFDDLIEIWASFHLNNFDFRIAKKHIRKEFDFIYDLFTKKCADFGIVAYLSKAELYCSFIEKYYTKYDFKIDASTRDTIYTFLLDNFEAFPDDEEYPYSKTLYKLFMSDEYRDDLGMTGKVQRMINFLLPKASEYLALCKSSDDRIELLTRALYLRFPTGVYDDLSYTPLTHCPIRSNLIKVFTRALSFGGYDRALPIYALKNLTGFDIGEYSTSDLKSMLSQYKEGSMRIEFVLFFLHSHEKCVEWKEVAGSSEFIRFVVHLVNTKPESWHIYHLSDHVVVHALHDPEVLERCARGGLFKQLDDYMTASGLDRMANEFPLRGLINEDSDEVFCNLSQYTISHEDRVNSDAPKLFTRLSRLVDDGRHVDNLIDYFWYGIRYDNFEQVLRSLGTKLGLKILEKYFLQIAENEYLFKKEDIEWLRPSPGDSSSLSVKKQFVRDPNSLRISEIVYLSLRERDKYIAEALYPKIDSRVYRIKKCFKKSMSDGLSPVLGYVRLLQGYSEVHIEVTQLCLRHMLLWPQCLLYSANINLPMDSMDGCCRYEMLALFSESKNLAMFPPGMLYVEEQVLAHSLFMLFYRSENIDQPTWPEWFRRAFSDLAEHLLLNFDYRCEINWYC